ncbi:myosin light chain kinase 3-like, partial [Sorex fumeus]|uniref:myosin light chain kinase 3-like n=1 Tax=Sorex fumeus TaxID=62283 RepID=UPI0024AE16A9
MFPGRRLQGLTPRFHGPRLEQRPEKAERAGSLLEGPGTQDSSAGANKAKEKVWLHPSLKESAFVRGKRTSALPERSSQKTQPSSAQEKVHRLNKKNAEKTKVSLTPGSLGTASPRDRGGISAPRDATKPRERLEGRDISGPERLGRQDGDERKTSGADSENLVFPGQKNGLPSAEDTRGREAEKNGATAAASEHEPDESWKGKQSGSQSNGDQVYERCLSGVKAISTLRTPGSPAGGPCFQQTEPTEPAGHSKRRGTEERASNEDSKKSKTDAASQRTQDPCPAHESLQDQSPGPNDKPSAPQDLGMPLDDTLAPPAPFPHRMVTAKKAAISSFYAVDRSEILGGGRFGQVHRCEEKATGLKLAAKIIKTRTAKEKDEVKNEINIMNQLDHVNLIQLYDAFESKNDCILVMEYVDGGELFDRIIDESYRLTELDVIQFTRQICEGVRHMHQMYILHLDLKHHRHIPLRTLPPTITIITTATSTTIITSISTSISTTTSTTVITNASISILPLPPCHYHHHHYHDFLIMSLSSLAR